MATKTKIDCDTPIKDFVMGSGKVKRPRPEAETQARIDRDGNAVEVSTDVPDTLALVGDVDGQTMRNIIGAPIETDEVSVLTSHNTPEMDSEAPDNATISNVEDGTAESGTPVPADRSNKTYACPAVDRSGKTGAGTVSIAPPAHTTLTEGGEPSVQTEHTALPTPAISTVSTEPRDIIVPTPHTATTEPSADINDTAPIVPALDTDPARRTVKQRKSDLDEYRQRYMRIPRLADRKPVFLSRATRDRLDRIVRLLGERGMSVSGLIENIALRHLETHEPDIEYWRKM